MEGWTARGDTVGSSGRMKSPGGVGERDFTVALICLDMPSTPNSIQQSGYMWEEEWT